MAAGGERPERASPPPLRDGEEGDGFRKKEVGRGGEASEFGKGINGDSHVFFSGSRDLWRFTRS